MYSRLGEKGDIIQISQLSWAQGEGGAELCPHCIIHIGEGWLGTFSDDWQHCSQGIIALLKLSLTQPGQMFTNEPNISTCTRVKAL